MNPLEKRFPVRSVNHPVRWDDERNPNVLPIPLFRLQNMPINEKGGIRRDKNDDHLLIVVGGQNSMIRFDNSLRKKNSRLAVLIGGESSFDIVLESRHLQRALETPASMPGRNALSFQFCLK
ncbi:MAG: hypothetical protein ACYDBP_04630 [Leptospirales bacterium]